MERKWCEASYTKYKNTVTLISNVKWKLIELPHQIESNFYEHIISTSSVNYS